MIVVVDTNVLIFLAQADSPHHARADALRAALEERKAQILFPTIVIAEYLVGVPAVRRPEHLQALAGIGTVVPFDVRAAVISAEIQSNRDAFTKAKETSNRRAVLADVKILATAIAHGALHIYTENHREMRILADAGHYSIGISGIPDNPGVQLDLLAATGKGS